jgi:hypothetical protein
MKRRFIIKTARRESAGSFALFPQAAVWFFVFRVQ